MKVFNYVIRPLRDLRKISMKEHPLERKVKQQNLEFIEMQKKNKIKK